MLTHEFKETHKGIETETRIYLDIDSKDVILYQYRFYKDKVLDTNCVHIPIQQFGTLTKSVLKSFLIMQPW